MADQLLTPEDLASLLERDDIDRSKAVMLIECVTAVIQEATGGQRIVLVENDTFQIMATRDQWLALPQIPVVSVASVDIDGNALTEGTGFKRFGNRLWRKQGWSNRCTYPWTVPQILYGQDLPQVNGVYSHGFADGSQDLQLARAAGISILKGVYGNPTGATSEAIDDYSVSYELLAVQLEASPYLKAALRSKYGRRAGIVRVG